MKLSKRHFKIGAVVLLWVIALGLIGKLVPVAVEAVELQKTKNSIESIDKQMEMNSESWNAYEDYINAEKQRIKALQNELELQNRQLQEEKKQLQKELIGEVDKSFTKHQNQ